jgi:hypothetical protein
MPIYSPTGFLDITNATLRTSNLEAQNFRLNGGNIYVTSELTTDELLNLDNVVNAGNATSNTVQFTNPTTGLVVDSNIVVAGNVTAAFLHGDASNVTAVPAAQITGTLAVANGGTGTTTSTGTGSVVLSDAPTFTGDVTFDTNTLFVDSANDRVGVGTNDPVSGLTVFRDIESSNSFITERVLFRETWPNGLNSLVGDLGTWVVTNLNQQVNPNITTTPDGYGIVSFNGNDASNGTFTSPAFDLSDYAIVDGTLQDDDKRKTTTRVFMKFWLGTRQLDASGEVVQVQFSPNNGTTWYTVATSQDRLNDNRFTMVSADLSPYILSTGTPPQAKIRFYLPWTIAAGDYVRIGRIWIHESDVPTNLGGMWLGAGGKIGIGTDTPVYKLDVNGEIQLRGQGFIYHANETIDSEASRYFLQFNKTLDASYPMLCNRTPSGDVAIATGTAAGGGDVERMRFNGGDGTITMNVGRGDVYFENNTNDNASGSGITLRTPTNPGSTGSIFAVRSSGNGCRLWVGQDVTGVASDSDFCAGQNGYAVGSENDRSTYNFIVKAGGNVGIGTTSPGARLHVYDGVGTVASEMILGPNAAADQAGIVKYFHGDGSGTGYTIVGNWGDSMSSGTGLVVKKGGNVGIGTTNPVGINGGQRIEGSSSGGFEYIATRNQSAVGDGSFIGAYLFKNNDADGTPAHYAGMSAKATGTGGNMVLYFHTAREKYETDTPAMTLDQNSRLEVGGDRLLVGTDGKVGLTLNDGGGNANLTFNHVGRLPDQNGSSARITSAVDGTTGDLTFSVRDNVTAGTTIGTVNTMRMRETYVQAFADFYVDGKLGVGTTSPYAKLHVVGNSGSISSGTHYGFQYNNAVQSYTGVHSGISIYADDDIVAGNWVLSHAGTMGSSDERIKKEIVDVEDGEALSIIRLLKPKRYKYRDDVKRGIEPVWGFIAQEVADTIPYATQKRTECIPNIYETASVSASNVITFTNFNTINLESNATSRLKLYDTENNEHMVKLVGILGEHSIQVEEDLTEWIGSFDESNTDGNDIFVYGEEVNDFHFLKKDAIWTVTTAALQEVDRQLQVEKARNDALEARILALENA